MHAFRPSIILLLLALASQPVMAQSTPPFSGTIFIDPDIVLPSDPTVYQNAVYTGRGFRTVYDRRVNNWVSINAYLYELSFANGWIIEAQVNPEFGSESAGLEQAEFYGPLIGQLPAALRRDISWLWIHKGTQPFGGGNSSILIHTGQSELYINDGILEETLIHEAAHTSLDGDHYATSGWIAAQDSDPTFISTYARDNPTREDVAESFLTYMAIRYRSDRISQSLYDTIVSTIPARIAYFDAQNFDMQPVAGGSVASEEIPAAFDLNLSVAPNPVSTSATIKLTLDRPRTVRIEILDMLGRVVAEVAAGEYPAGDSAYLWDTSGLAAGVYIYRAVLDGAVVSRMASVVR